MTETPAPYTPPQPGRSTAGTLIFLLLGPLVWGARFVAAYGAQGAMCELGAPQAAVTAALLAITVPALAVLVFALAAPAATARLLRAHKWGSETGVFLSAAMRILVALSIFGVLGEGLLAPLILPACPVLR